MDEFDGSDPSEKSIKYKDASNLTGGNEMFFRRREFDLDIGEDLHFLAFGNQLGYTSYLHFWMILRSDPPFQKLSG